MQRKEELTKTTNYWILLLMLKSELFKGEMAYDETHELDEIDPSVLTESGINWDYQTTKVLSWHFHKLTTLQYFPR